MQALIVAPGTLGRALPGKAWHKILIGTRVLQGSILSFPYYLQRSFDLRLEIPPAETIILCIRRYIRNADIVMLQLVERHVLLCVHLVCREKHQATKRQGKSHELYLLGEGKEMEGTYVKAGEILAEWQRSRPGNSIQVSDLYVPRNPDPCLAPQPYSISMLRDPCRASFLQQP